MATCRACGFENPAGFRFCGGCAAALAGVCPACGAESPPGFRFCGQCAAPLDIERTPFSVGEGDASPKGPVAERRLVSVLFADLVGFTGLSEHRDAEDVRDLLSTYFDTCRELIGRYGGVVEKFIGDAVMAVWGTPSANEDDAERAVRAALDLVGAVEALGAETGADGLRARAGVLTGEAAVNLGAVGQGMVAGDLVNTASRLQGLAEPGAVLVGDATRRATEAAIAYQDEGAHSVKGRTEPLSVWRALRVIAARRGAQRSHGLESPFVGRERELKQLKDLFHACAEGGRAHVVSVVGIAGIGKSRLSWELEKYADGLIDSVHWHRGRCLSYGEGVTYSALADMVRMRARIVEAEDAAPARAKLRAAVREFVPDDEERRWVEPRLANLVGLEDAGPREKEDLFAAWRLFFERIAERAPTVLVFEDMQWADTALVEFVEYLLDWSRAHPLFVLSLSRPELSERHPGWATGKRNFTSVYLEPLSAPAMEAMLEGLVPGLPGEVRDRILDRAEGVPLYAMETVRMLLDRGLLVREGSVYRPTGPIDSLAVPETLQALIAARLDGLAPRERGLLQDAAVLGKTFTTAGLAALSGLKPSELEGPLASLVRKEVLAPVVDPRSPERGQYQFLQDLVRRVAYETLSKRERRARHLAVAAHLQSTWESGEEEISEVLAAHYLEAHRLAPEADDAADIRERAGAALVRAGERAGSLAATDEAERYFSAAADLANEAERASLLEQAGLMAQTGGRSDRAVPLYEEAIRLYDAAGMRRPSARVSARLGDVLWWDQDRIEEALERMEAAFVVLADDEPDEGVAAVAAQIGRLQCCPRRSTRSNALALGIEHELSSATLRAYVNLSNWMTERDRLSEAMTFQLDGITLARRLGNRGFEWFLLSHRVGSLWLVGEWDAAIATAAEIPDYREVPDAKTGFSLAAWSLLKIAAARGELERVDEILGAWEGYGESRDVQVRAAFATVHALADRARGRLPEALASGRRALEAVPVLSMQHPVIRDAFDSAVEAALELGQRDAARELLASVEALPPGHRPPCLAAQCARFRARMREEDPSAVDADFRLAIETFGRIGMPFMVAVAQLEHAQWLAAEGETGRAEQPLAESRAAFERLGARPWLERADGALGVRTVPTVSA